MKIVSGGQTGVDRAALDAALGLGLECGGWCPKGRRAEDGPVPDRYPLREAVGHGYSERTRLNVALADATLIISRGKPSGGTKLTIGYARRLGKPYLVVNLLSHRRHPRRVAAWLNSRAVTVLNVAGPRESKAPGIHAQAQALLEETISSLPHPPR